MNVSIIAMAVFYILAGINHFRDPGFYFKMMPKYLPAHKELILISGGFEILFGTALFFEPIRNYALMGIILLLIAIFPANIEMLTSNNFKKIPLKWKVMRLPFQGVFIFWAYFHLNHSL